MGKKKQLFEEEEDQQPKESFSINTDFAKKYEHNERRKLLEKAKEKYGEKALLDSAEDESDQSSSEEEDDDGELINPKFEKKFLETMRMIRENDPKLKET